MMKHLAKRPHPATAAATNALYDIAAAHNGILKAELVVDAARDKDSPLHKYFEWDDHLAAEQARFIQARLLISRVSVNVMPSKNQNRVTRAFVSLSIDRSNGGGYRVATEVLSNDTLRQQMIEDSIEMMASFRTKYAALHELGSVFNEMKRAEEKLKNQTEQKPVEVRVNL